MSPGGKEKKHYMTGLAMYKIILKHKVFNYDEVQFIFSAVSYTFGVIFTFTISSKSFIDLGLRCRSLRRFLYMM